MSKVVKDIVPFIAGALVVGISTLLARDVSTKLSALLYGFPFTMIPISYFLWRTTKIKYGKQKLIDYIGQSLPSMVGLVIFILAFWLSLKKFSYWISLGIAVSSWLVMAGIYWILICPSPFNKFCINFG